MCCNEIIVGVGMEAKSGNPFQQAKSQDFFEHVLEELSKVDPSLLEGQYLIQIIRDMNSYPAKYDESCPFNIRTAGEKFFGVLRTFKSIDADSVATAFGFAFRFCWEASSFHRDSSMELVANGVIERISQLRPSALANVHYAIGVMGAHMARDALRGPGLRTVEALAAKMDLAEKALQKFDEEQTKRMERTRALGEAIKRAESDYNFVGLNEGFHRLSKVKQAELKNHRIGLISLGVALILVPIAALVGSFFINSDKIAGYIIHAVPLVGLEFVLVYFFRVVLAHYHSVRGQLLQLSLRQTLCQFIDAYAEYSVQAGQQARGSLDRFESIIFSNLAAEPDQIPSTFDGLEQISKLVAAVRSGR